MRGWGEAWVLPDTLSPAGLARPEIRLATSFKNVRTANLWTGWRSTF